MLFLVCLFVINFLSSWRYFIYNDLRSLSLAHFNTKLMLYVKKRDHLSFLEKVERHFQQKQERNITFPHQPEGLSDVLFRFRSFSAGNYFADYLVRRAEAMIISRRYTLHILPSYILKSSNLRLSSSFVSPAQPFPQEMRKKISWETSLPPNIFLPRFGI